MARKKTLAENFRERLDGLVNAIADDLRLPSLEENRLEGYAWREEKLGWTRRHRFA